MSKKKEIQEGKTVFWWSCQNTEQNQKYISYILPNVPLNIQKQTKKKSVNSGSKVVEISDGIREALFPSFNLQRRLISIDPPSSLWTSWPQNSTLRLFGTCLSWHKPSNASRDSLFFSFFLFHFPPSWDVFAGTCLLENLVWSRFLNPQHLFVAARPHRLIKHTEYQKHYLFFFSAAAAPKLPLPRAFFCHQAFKSLAVKSYV